MNVTFNGTSSVTLTKPNGAEVSINGVNIVSVNATSYEDYPQPFPFNPNFQTSEPQVWNPTTGTWSGGVAQSVRQWVVYVKLVDGFYEKLIMGEVGGAGSGWANSQAGANSAVAAFEAIMV